MFPAQMPKRWSTNWGVIMPMSVRVSKPQIWQFNPARNSTATRWNGEVSPRAWCLYLRDAGGDRHASPRWSSLTASKPRLRQACGMPINCAMAPNSKLHGFFRTHEVFSAARWAIWVIHWINNAGAKHDILGKKVPLKRTRRRSDIRSKSRYSAPYFARNRLVAGRWQKGADSGV